MSLPLAFVALIGGFVLLIWAGDLMVRGAAALARHWGIPALIVGLTIVAFGTSAPEMVVSIGAVLKDMADPLLETSALATGNVIGSNIANVLLVLGVPALIMAIPTNIAGVGRNSLIALLATVVFIVLLFIHAPLARWQGAILFGGIVLYLVWMFGLAKAGANDPILQEMQDIEEGEDGLPRKLTVDIVFVVLGIIGLAIGGKLIVDSASLIATSFGVSDAVIGLTIVAIGTSLPELATVVLAAYRGHPEVAIGNVLGSNVFNIFAVMGAAALAGPVRVPSELYTFDIWVMLAAMLALTMFVLTRAPITKKVGIAFVIGYLLYLGGVARNLPSSDSAAPQEASIAYVLPQI